MSTSSATNLSKEVVNGFGDEWKKFDQSELSKEELEFIGEEYFRIFPWEMLPENASGFDLGCGSGRWAKLVAPRVGHLHCIDPSIAIEVAKKNLSANSNCSINLFCSLNLISINFLISSIISILYLIIYLVFNY